MTIRAFPTFLLATVLCLPATVQAADCAPEPMVHIVSAVAMDDPDSFGTQPKVLYRSGALLGRMEEELNPETGLHLLFVVNAPDVWIANLADGTGQHIVDSDPEPGFGAPILDMDRFATWKGFEFGCEVDFLEGAGAERIELRPDGSARLSLKRDGAEVHLFTDGSGTPVKLVVDGADGFEVTYLEYERLDLDPSLFEKPAGVDFVEAGES